MPTQTHPGTVMKTFFLFSLAFALVACDGMTEEDLATPEPGFEATVSGAFQRSLSGDARTSDLEGSGARIPINEGGSEELSVFLFDDADAGESLVFIGLTEEALAPGVYGVNGLGRDGLGLGFTVAYRYGGSDPSASSVSFSESGSVTIEQADDQTVTGRFTFTAQAIVDGAPPTTEPVTVEGTFVVDLRERSTGGSR